MGYSRDVTFPLNPLSGQFHRDVAALSRVTSTAISSGRASTTSAQIREVVERRQMAHEMSRLMVNLVPAVANATP